MTLSENRHFLYYVIFGIVGLSIAIRLFYLQVIDKSYEELARDISRREIVQFPPRGLIYDRNGVLLVYNDVIYDLMVVPRQVKDLDTAAFCDLLKITREQFVEKMKKAIIMNGDRRSSVFEKQISPKAYASFQEKLFNFTGFFIEVRTDRKYNTHSMAHVLGNTGEVSEKRIEQSNGYYRQGEFVGLNGIERSYEELLRGTKGVRNMMVDVWGREIGPYGGGALDTVPASGTNLYVTLDAELQALGEKLLQNKVGSVVAIEPSTGDILALVSSPGYDPNEFIGRERGNNYMKLLRDPMKPLFNRPLNAPYPPGSVFKIIESLIGQQEGTLTPETMYGCGGGYRVGNHTVKCSHRHYSPLDLRGAIEQSCNPYYCHVFRAIMDQKKFKSTAEAYDNWYKHMQSFGVGTQLGIDLYGESKGILYPYTYFDKLYGKNSWRSTNVISLSIGQGEVGITPLQMANVVAIVANRGYFITPHILKYIGDEKKIPDQFTKRRYASVDTQYYETVVEGMARVVNNGTARIAQIKDIQVCGKTGTAQNPHGDDHSVFIGFAPMYNPKIAIAVVVENGGFGARWAAPIASLMMEYYLSKHAPTTRPDLQKRMEEGNLINKLPNVQ
ncbi:MAG: penicillin-binding protein 2 [Bacteroidetes bacterium]|nr:MAG: penicillin-binding protein 2 [Bacteroidota bacterium]